MKQFVLLPYHQTTEQSHSSGYETRQHSAIYVLGFFWFWFCFFGVFCDAHVMRTCDILLCPNQISPTLESAPVGHKEASELNLDRILHVQYVRIIMKLYKKKANNQSKLTVAAVC